MIFWNLLHEGLPSSLLLGNLYPFCVRCWCGALYCFPTPFASHLHFFILGGGHGRRPQNTAGRERGVPPTQQQFYLGVSHATIDFVIESVSRVSKLEII